MSIPEFRELSSIEESVMEPVPSPGSVLCVLLIHLNKFCPAGPVPHQDFSPHQSPRTNFLVSRVLILNSPSLFTVRLPRQFCLLQASPNWSSKVTVFFCLSFPCYFRLYEVFVKTSRGMRILVAELLSYNSSHYLCVVVLTA